MFHSKLIHHLHLKKRGEGGWRRSGRRARPFFLSRGFLGLLLLLTLLLLGFFFSLSEARKRYEAKIKKEACPLPCKAQAKSLSGEREREGIRWRLMELKAGELSPEEEERMAEVLMIGRRGGGIGTQMVAFN